MSVSNESVSAVSQAPAVPAGSGAPKPVSGSKKPSVGEDGQRIVRVWFQNRKTGETEVGRIVYKNPELDNSLLSAIIACWSLGSHPEILDFLIATDHLGRAVVTQKELYSYSYRCVQEATEAYVTESNAEVVSGGV